jgi:hypothetical protein
MDLPKRNLYINTGLLTGVLALAAVLWLPEQRASAFKPFAHINANAVDRIEIIVPQQPPALLQRRNGAWRVFEQPAVEIDAQRLGNVLNILNESVEHAYDAADLDPQEFGLEPPLAILKLGNHIFYFGANEPMSGQRYVLHGNRLYLLADTHYPLLSRGIGNLINEQSPSGNTDEVGIK